MTKKEAIAAMMAGHTITHRYFTGDECMRMTDGKITLEDGVKCTPDEFWKWRTDEFWNDGYKLFNPNV